jgi:hypothetical protein
MRKSFASGWLFQSCFSLRLMILFCLGQFWSFDAGICHSDV